MKWDAFISHASEDKGFARTLVSRLVERGVAVWFDEETLKLGDSLRRSIDIGIKESRFGLVVLSPNFFKKSWTQWELDGLVELSLGGESKILPVWLDIGANELRKVSPSLAGIVAVNANDGIKKVVDKIIERINPTPRAPAMQLMGRMRLRQHNTIDPFFLKEILKNFADMNTIFRLNINLGDTEHEWGRGGCRNNKYALEDELGNIYFCVETKDEWGTMSDDSEDYDQGTEIKVSAYRPLFDDLSGHVIRGLSEFPEMYPQEGS